MVPTIWVCPHFVFSVGCNSRNSLILRIPFYSVLLEEGKEESSVGNSSLAGKSLDCWSEGHEFKSQHCQSAIVGHLSSGFTAQMYSILTVSLKQSTDQKGLRALHNLAMPRLLTRSSGQQPRDLIPLILTMPTTSFCGQVSEEFNM